MKILQKPRLIVVMFVLYVTSVLAQVPLPPTNLQAQTSVPGASNINGIRYIDGVTYPKTAAGINAAITSFGSDPACGTIILPYGIIPIEVTIGGANTVDRASCVLKGQGAAAFDDGFGDDGTILRWTGAANGTVVDLHSCFNCKMTDVLIDGEGTAGIGFLISAASADGISMNNSGIDVNVRDIMGTPGIGISIDGAVDYEVEAATIDTSYIDTVKTAIYMEGVNTWGTNIRNITVSSYANTCFDGVSGQVVMINLVCSAPTTGTDGAIAIRNTFRDFSGMGIVVENSTVNAPCFDLNDGSASTNGPSILFTSGACGSSSGSSLFNYTQNGRLTLINMEMGIASNTVTINPAGAAASGYIGTINFKNNRWYSTVITATGSNYAYTGDDGIYGSAYHSKLTGGLVPGSYSILDAKTQALVGGSQSCFINASVTYCWLQNGFGLRLMQDANIMMMTGSPTTAALGGGYPLAVQDLYSNSYNMATKLLISTTAPTISSGFGTSPSITANNGTAGFRVNVGTGGSATSGVIGLPAATTGWNCQANDITTTGATVFLTKQTASSTTTATIGNFSTAGAAAAWTASDVLAVSCFAY